MPGCAISVTDMQELIRGKNALRGIFLVLAGVALLASSDAFAKALGAHYPAVQLLFVRGAIALPIMLAVLLLVLGPRGLRTGTPGLHLLRGVISIATACCFYYALTLMPLAETTVLAFCAPLFVTAISAFVLKDVVSPRSWLAVGLGFLGVLIIVRPDGGTWQWAVLLPVASALGYAVLMLSARRIGRDEHMLTTLFYIVLGQLVVAAIPVVGFWRPLDAAHLPGLLGIAVCSTLGLGLITQAFRATAAAVIAPFEDTAIVWATAFGWLFWHEVPGFWFYTGTALVIASGVYGALPARPRPVQPPQAADSGAGLGT